jgi:acyl carrier protein
MEVMQEVVHVLDDVLGLNGRAATFSRGTHLLGAVPELDSMAVLALITGLEERFGIVIDDDDVTGETFATVGTLADFIGARIGRATA